MTMRPGRRTLRDAALILVAGLVATGVALLWTAPAPLFSTDHAVPRLLDLDLATAQTRLRGLGYRSRFGGTRPHPTAAPGIVVAQDPPPGVVLSSGAVVELTTSAGPTQVPVPDVSGFVARQAIQVLHAAGLEGATVDSVPTDPGDTGVVMATRPPAGTPRDPGSTIGLVISTTRAATP